MKNVANYIWPLFGCIVGIIVTDKVQKHIEHKRFIQNLRNDIAYRKKCGGLM